MAAAGPGCSRQPRSPQGSSPLGWPAAPKQHLHRGNVREPDPGSASKPKHLSGALQTVIGAAEMLRQMLVLLAGDKCLGLVISAMDALKILCIPKPTSIDAVHSRCGQSRE